MKRVTVFSVLALVALISAISLPLLAGPFGGIPHDGSPGKSMERRIRKMVAELKLTADQQTKMTAARDAFKFAQIDLRSNLAKQRLEIEKAMRPQSNTSETQMMLLFEQQASTQAKLAMERYRLQSTMRSVLTPAQLEKLEAMKAERGEKMRERKHKRMGMPGSDQGDKKDEGDEDDDSSRPPCRPW